MVNRQLLGRLGIAAIALAAVVAGLVILGDEDAPAPAVAVVGAPSTSWTTSPPSTVWSTPPPVAAPVAGGLTVLYELAGSGTATVVYDSNGLGLVHQELDVRLPWRTELTWPATGAPPTVQLQGQGTGPLECRVTVRGRLVVSQQAAAGETATCAGRLT
jgi:hypothetical protein